MLKKLLTAVLAMALSVSGFVYAEDIKSIDDRGVVNFSGEIDLSGVSGGEYKKVTYRMLNPGVASSDIITTDNIQTALQCFGQTVTDDSGHFSFSLRIKGETGKYTLVISNIISGQREYEFDYVSNLYIDFNDALSGGNDKVREFMLDYAEQVGFNYYAYNLLPDAEKDIITGEILAAGAKTENAQVTELFAGIDAESRLLEKQTDTDIICNYLKSSYTKSARFNNDIMKLFAEKLSADSQKSVAAALAGKKPGADIKDLCAINVLKCYVDSMEYFVDVNKIINDEKNIWQFDASDIETFNNTINDKNNVLEAMFTGTDDCASMTEYRNLFKSKVAEQKKAEADENSNSNSGGGGGGSGSGGGGNSGITYTVPSPFTGTGTVINTNTPVVQPQKTVIFDDLGSVSWAEEAINYLYDRKIVSGVSATKFDPDAQIKREEFVKLITASMRLTGVEADMPFGDVADGTWYYAPIAAAARAKIVSGDESGNFGVGNNISREDAAVMLSRAAAAVKYEFGNNKGISFTDENDISGYALDSVKKLSGAGIINGMEDGGFAPKQGLTRAQAAKMVYLLFTATKTLY